MIWYNYHQCKDHQYNNKKIKMTNNKMLNKKDALKNMNNY